MPPLTPLMQRAAELRQTGHQVTVLAQAMVDYAPPESFTSSLLAELPAGRQLHGYAPDPGLAELRAALATYLDGAFGLTVDPGSELIVTPGANHAAYMPAPILLWNKAVRGPAGGAQFRYRKVCRAISVVFICRHVFAGRLGFNRHIMAVFRPRQNSRDIMSASSDMDQHSQSRPSKDPLEQLPAYRHYFFAT